MRKLVATVELEELQRMLDILIRAEADLALSPLPRLALETVLIRLSRLPAGVDVGTLITRLEELEKKLTGQLPELPSAPVGRAVPAEQEASRPPPGAVEKKSEALPAEEESDKSWAGLVAFVKQRQKPRIYALLEQASLLLLELPRLRVGLPEKYFNLAGQDIRQALQELASAYFAAPVKVELEKVANGEQAPPSLHQQQQRQESDRQKKLRENALEHPVVKSALDIFDGTVDNIKPIDKGYV